jgi:phage tail-like protein
MDDMDLKKSEAPVGAQSRREFLRSTLLLAGAVGLQGLPRFSGTAMGVITSAYTSARFGMELDGQFLTLLKSVDGGFARADVVQEKIGPTPFAKKHIANLKYTDIAIECDVAMPPALSKWISAALNMNVQRKSGSIITADFNGKEVSRLDFNNAFISEFTIPACDRSSKDPGYVTIKMSPEFTTALAGKGGTLPTELSLAKQKSWLPANFRLQIQGLEDASTNVMRIEPITIKQKVADQPVGELRTYQKEPASFEYSNLAIYLPEVSAGPFFQWFQDFVVKGNNTDDKEKAGFLDLISPDKSTSMLRINFNHLGIFSFAPVKAQASTDTIRQVKVEMYCEQITI